GVLLVMFISFAASLIPLAFLLSSFVNTAKAALVLGFFVFALSYVLNQILTNGGFIYFLYSEDVNPIFRYMFSLYSPFNFAKVFADINGRTIPKLNEETREHELNVGYTWDALYKENTLKVPLVNIVVTTPGSIYALQALWINAISYIILAWYLD